ncbi:MAG: xanthine dehydrogenase YagR molybdenum-binding subunit [Planctomycetota bacterium]|jgi:xanthine dehydrogenase YagR molybdenum-binding subunit
MSPSSKNSLAGPVWKPREEMEVLNKDIPRLDGPDKVTGRARYTADIRLPDMVFVRLLVSEFPRAIIHAMDVGPARDVPGVLYAEENERRENEVRYHGSDSVLAIVAATSPEAAEDGIRAIEADLEELYPPVVTPEQSKAADAPEISSRGNVGGEGGSGNLEDAERELGFSDAVVEATYTLPVQHHVCLETHAITCDYRGGDEATVYASTQTVSGANREAARWLEMDADKVRVVTHHMGGGFGSKFGLGIEGKFACQVSRALERPAHLLLTRRDEFIMAGNRSGSRQSMKGGATKDGKITALITDADKYGGMGGGALPTTGRPYIYSVPVHYTQTRTVRTATDPNRAMRAPGHPQASFAMESMVDELAYAVGVDPLTFRKNNLEHPAYQRQLDRVAAEIGWEEHPHKTTHAPADGSVQIGIGFGVSVWSSGSRPGSHCEVRVFPDGSVTSTTGTQDLGTGSRTYVAAIVAEEFGLPLEAVTARIGESTYPNSAGSGGSVTTGCSAPAIKDAAHKARVAFEEKIAQALGADGGDFVWRGGRVHVAGDASRSLDWKQACALLGTDAIVAMGEWQESLRDTGVQGAQAVKVSVDTLTGEIRALKMVFIQNCGLVLNRMAARSQINGGQIQALSYGLLEERIYDPELGLLLTGNLETYKIAGSKEMPEIVSILDDGDDRLAVMGMAEANCIPGHGALACAVYNACGVRMRDMPLTPDKLVMALHGA